MNWLTILLIMISIAILVIVAFIYKNKDDCQKEKYETISKEKIKLKMVAYNVLFGLWCRPESVGKMVRPYKFDIICLCLINIEKPFFVSFTNYFVIHLCK